LAEEAALFALVGSSCLLSLEAGSGPWIVEANPQQLSQVFRNLVLNAVQAMPQGGTVTLAFRRQPGDRIAISVVDEGPGIATGVQPRIFEPYFSTRPQGTGLGLSVAREVIQRHGGTIEFESREGQGCCFTVFLPGARKASDVAEPPTQGPVLQGHRVLVMEDEADLRDLMVEVSVSLGMEATACRNGREAVTVFDTFRAEGRPFSLVVSDLLVPGDMGGREMIAQLRSRSGEFRALAVTGFSTHRFVEDFQHQGFDVIVGKPFTVDEFKTRIVELMKDPWKNVSNI
jgi:CheY-like chemotaxis protein/anti-sigma regulatory factor (Ser/Thr protein kinase)